MVNLLVEVDEDDVRAVGTSFPQDPVDCTNGTINQASRSTCILCKHGTSANAHGQTKLHASSVLRR